MFIRASQYDILKDDRIKHLLTGRRFRLEHSTMALDVVEGKRVAITVPTGATIKVVSGPTSESDRLVDVVWAGRTVAMFAYDVSVRGTEIKEPISDIPKFSRGAKAS
jgi:hypothetical protein